MTRDAFLKLLDYSDESWAIIRQRIVDAWDAHHEEEDLRTVIEARLAVHERNDYYSPVAVELRRILRFAPGKSIDFNATGGHMPGCPNLSGGVCDCSGPVEAP